MQATGLGSTGLRSLNKAGNQSRTRHSLWKQRPVWKTVDILQRCFTAAPKMDIILGTTVYGRYKQESGEAADRQGSAISSDQKWYVKQKYFHILLRELRIYLDRTRGNCGKTNQESVVLFIQFLFFFMSRVFYDKLTPEKNLVLEDVCFHFLFSNERCTNISFLDIFFLFVLVTY